MTNAHQIWNYQLVENLMFICTKNQIHPSLLSWSIVKILQTSYKGYFGPDWPCPPMLRASTCRKVWCLFASKKSASSLPFFLRDCSDFEKLLFWVLWAWRKVPCLPSSKKIKFISHFFSDILLRCGKLSILGTLGWHSRHTHQKQYYQLKRKFGIYLHVIDNLIPYFFLEILHFKESYNLIDWKHFGQYLEN